MINKTLAYVIFCTKNYYVISIQTEDYLVIYTYMNNDEHIHALITIKCEKKNLPHIFYSVLYIRCNNNYNQYF